MGIKNIIIHEVRKEEHKASEIFTREKENKIDDHAEKLSSELSKLFRKTGLNTGRFITPEKKDDPKPQFVILLEKYFNKHSFEDFVSFSQSATREFEKHLNKSTASKGGYLWFNHYTHGDEHFLTVVLLRKKSALSLSSDLTLDKIEELDLDTLHMAARINLSAWLEGVSSKFIAFRIGHGAKDVTDYFSKFVGCEEYTRARVDTQNLVLVTKQYCTTHKFSDDKSESVKRFVFDQCINWMNDDKPVLLESISSLLDDSFKPENKGAFLDIAQDEPYSLNNEVPIERSALKGLTRYFGKTKKMSISFDSELLNVSVFFDEETGTINITELPEKLIAQLISETPEQ